MFRYASTLKNLIHVLAYRASSIRVSGDFRSAYLSFKNGAISAADSIFQNKDPVFTFIDWETLGNELRFDITVPVTAPASSTSLLEKMCLGMLLKLHNPLTIFEFGTYRGATTCLLFKNAVEVAKIYSFDIPSEIENARWLDRTKFIRLEESNLRDDLQREFFPKSDNVTQVYADLMQVDWKYIKELPKPDFVFIDELHSYEACLRDSENLINWVGDEAMIVWHDATWRKFIYLEANYGVHSSIVAATSPAAIPYTFRIKDTSLMVRSKAHQAIFERNLCVQTEANARPAANDASLK